MTAKEEALNQLDQVFGQLPEVLAGRGVWQNNFHEFDVYGHTSDFVSRVRQMTSRPEIIAAAWLHDIGKPVVAKPKLDPEGRPRTSPDGQPYHDFNDHEKVGEEMVRKMDPGLFRRFGLDQDRVAGLVGAHYLPMKGIKAMRQAEDWPAFKQAFLDLERQLEDASVGKTEVLTMFLADKLAQGRFCTDRDELLAIREALLDEYRTNVRLKSIYRMQRPVA